MAGVVETIAIGVGVALVSRVLADRIAALIREDVLTGSAREELMKLMRACQDIQHEIGVKYDDNWLLEAELIWYDAEDLVDKILLLWSRKKKKNHFKLSKKYVDCIKDVSFRLACKVSQQPTMASTSSQSRRPPELRSNCEFREEMKKAIIEELLDDDGSPGVTLILGVNGVGKTALADAITKDARITSEFSCIKISMASATNFTEAEDKVREFLKDQQPTVTERADDPAVPQPSNPRKLLILLDGLTNVESIEWYSFKGGFLEEQAREAQMSKVLITSRNPRVANVTGSGTHRLDELGSGDCYTLIERYANSNRNLNSDDCGALEMFKEKLGTKCYGLPLLAYRLGLLLSAQREGHRLEKLRHIDSKDILKLLKSEKALSDLLPSFLPFEPYTQRCLAYCSLFPLVHDFEKAGMVELWISEGFVHDSKHGLEDSAIAYFDEIISHSIYQQPDQQQEGGGENEESYKMHKLFHDLAKQVVGEISCGLVAGTPTFTPELKHIDFSRKRHLSLCCPEMRLNEHRDISKELGEYIEKAERLRTFLLMGRAGRHIYTNPTFFKSLVYLRVLDLSHSNLTKLNISMLEQLRFLDLSFTPVSDLGKLTNVFALRTLKLKGCKRLLQLPDDISELTNLVCIEVRGAGLASTPPCIGKLRNLQTLDDFVAGNKEGHKIAELALLNSLKKSLCIKKLENVRTHNQAIQANLSDKKDLRTLELEWSDSELGDEPTHISTFEVLEALQPPKNLATLTITNYSGDEFPQWLGKREICGALDTLELRGCNGCINIPPEIGQLRMLKILRIRNCSNLATLPSLKQLASLQVLEINQCTNLEQLPILPASIKSEREFIPSKLEYLVLSDLPRLVGWILTPISMPLLHTLQVRNCSKLPALPSLEDLTSLQILQIDGCTNIEQLPLLPPSMRVNRGTLIITKSEMLMRRCEVGQADWEMIKHIPCICISTLSTVASTSPASEKRSANQDTIDGSRVDEEESPSADFQRKHSVDKGKGVAPENDGVASTSQVGEIVALESKDHLNASVASTSQVGEIVAPESKCPLNAGVASASQNGTSNGPRKLGKRRRNWFKACFGKAV